MMPLNPAFSVTVWFQSCESDALKPLPKDTGKQGIMLFTHNTLFHCHLFSRQTHQTQDTKTKTTNQDNNTNSKRSHRATLFHSDMLCLLWKTSNTRERLSNGSGYPS